MLLAILKLFENPSSIFLFLRDRYIPQLSLKFPLCSELPLPPLHDQYVSSCPFPYSMTCLFFSAQPPQSATVSVTTVGFHLNQLWGQKSTLLRGLSSGSAFHASPHRPLTAFIQYKKIFARKVIFKLIIFELQKASRSEC